MGSNKLFYRLTAYFLSKGLKMMTFGEYMAFFDKWLNYQFPRDEDAAHNGRILQIVGEIVSDADDLQYWANRDNWSMYYSVKDLT